MKTIRVLVFALLALLLTWGLNWKEYSSGKHVVEWSTIAHGQEIQKLPPPRPVRPLRPIPGISGDLKKAPFLPGPEAQAENEAPAVTSFTDPRDGRSYIWVQIGNQAWMAENLAYLPSVSPQTSGGDLDTAPVYYVYGYEGESPEEARVHPNYQAYGVLYNWHAALTACPPGWRLPTNDQWKELELFLGMSPDEVNLATKYRGDGVGTQLKAAYGWDYDKNGTNESGFTALPRGYRHRSGGGQFNHAGIFAAFWTATELSRQSATTFSTHAWFRRLNYNQPGVYYGVEGKSCGFSIRCVSD